jgi:hypothetical protein
MRAERGWFASLDPITKQKMLDMYAAGEKLIVIQAELGVSRATIHKYCSRGEIRHGQGKLKRVLRRNFQGAGKQAAGPTIRSAPTNGV